MRRPALTRLMGLAGLLVLLAGCAATSTGNGARTDGAEMQGKSATGQFKDIAATPLSDLNLVRTEIPAVLVAAQQGPYARPDDLGCRALAERVGELDAVLGPDLDVRPAATEGGLLDRGATLIGEAAVDAARSAAAGLLPFRSWVRKLTGAERHSKAVAAAIAAGVVRRAYLKGLGQATGCPAPAAPFPPAQPRAAEPAPPQSSGTKPSETELRQ